MTVTLDGSNAGVALPADVRGGAGSEGIAVCSRADIFGGGTRACSVNALADYEEIGGGAGGEDDNERKDFKG